eukprot:TRINITY_DN28624_c0_g1_i1.p1 TRINITY_DN28624_c0_g1~~TRINITY_DN28624_c0_g1_i1.p1  ORF type:complete len:598 (+),score=130.43 TRINITY_DN28624_c0_g1_i1:24-1796(+)
MLPKILRRTSPLAQQTRATRRPLLSRQDLRTLPARRSCADGASPSAPSCRRLASDSPTALPPPPPAPTAGSRPASPQGLQPASPEGGPDEQALDAVQELVQAVVESEHEKLLEEITKLVDAHFRRIGKLHAQQKTQPGAEEKERTSFLRTAGNLLTKRLGDGPVVQHLIERLELCHGHVELLHEHLWWASYQDSFSDEVNFSGDGDAAVDPYQLLRLTTKPAVIGTEARPLMERWVLDVSVSLERISDELGVVPQADRTILLSNIPVGTTEEDLRATLAVCGEIRSVELCEEWVDWQDRLQRSVSADQDGKDEEVTEEGDEDSNEKKEIVLPCAKAPPPYTLPYAIVEFEKVEARQMAMRDMPRLFGILMREVRLLKRKSGSVRKVVGRPAYPQDARLKRTLLIRDMKWVLQPWQVLEACGRKLATSNLSCHLSLSNCQVFGAPGNGPLQALDVQASSSGGTSISQVPSHYQDAGFCSSTATDAVAAPQERGGNGGAAVLRFQSFEDAYRSKQLLQGTMLGGKKIYCGFAPWRPACLPVDSRGNKLHEVHYLDMPVPRASARYGPDASRDPVHRWGTPEEEVSRLAASTN